MPWTLGHPWTWKWSAPPPGIRPTWECGRGSQQGMPSQAFTAWSPGTADMCCGDELLVSAGEQDVMQTTGAAQGTGTTEHRNGILETCSCQGM